MIGSSIRDQRGQALPLGVALILMVVLSGFVLFNTAQLVSEKSRAANAADASVYSGLVWQARALNFQAYTNRAMVANQVSIAQMVSLASWAAMHKEGTGNLQDVAGWIPYIGTVINIVAEAAQYVDAVTQAIVKTAIPVLDGVNGILSEAQQAMYVSTFLATPALVKTVVEKNRPDLKVQSEFSVASLADNAVHWNDFVWRYDNSDSDGIDRKANVVRDSRDCFTKERDWHFPNGVKGPCGEDVNPVSLINAIPLGDDGWIGFKYVFRSQLRKEGGTRLIRYEGSSGDAEWQWKGKDTLSLQVEHWDVGWFHVRWKRDETPIGWASRYVGNENCSSVSWGGQNCAWTAGEPGESGKNWWNRKAEGEADAKNQAIEAAYNGLRAYYDLQDLSEKGRDPRLKLRVQVDAPADSIRTSTHIQGMGSPAPVVKSRVRQGLAEKGMFHAADRLASASVSSISVGEVFFKRPVYPGRSNANELKMGGETKAEYASLFNPYWDVRLVDAGDAVRSAAWLLKDSGLASAATTGVSAGATAYQQQKVREVEALRDEIERVRALVENASEPGTRASLQQRLSDLQARFTQAASEANAVVGRIGQVRNGVLAAFTEGETIATVLRNARPSLAGLSDGKSILPTYDARGMVAAALTSGVNKDLIEDSAKKFITEAVEESLRAALASAVKQAISSGFDALGGDIVDRVKGVATTFSGVSAEGRAKIEAWKTELNSNIDEVKSRYESAKATEEQVVAGLEARLADVSGQLAELRGSLDETDLASLRAVNEKEQEWVDLHNRIDAGREKLDQLKSNAQRETENAIAEARAQIEALGDDVNEFFPPEEI